MLFLIVEDQIYTTRLQTHLAVVAEQVKLAHEGADHRTCRGAYL